MTVAPTRRIIEARPVSVSRSEWKEVSAMPKMKEAAAEFLASKRVAVTGVSRQPKDHGSNVVYRRLRERGYQVFPVNPNAERLTTTCATTTCARSPAASMRS
jgi:hypothetical protein